MSRLNKINSIVKKVIFATLFVVIAVIPHRALLHPPAANMADYTAYPPFITETAPPLVMLAMGRDHKIYYEAYNDASDIDDDGKLEVGYKDDIDYYGYFDYNKCYTYTSGQFGPSGAATGPHNHYCSGQWSGNFLNYLSMSRMDVIRKVFYGGYRSQDDAAKTYLEGVYIPQDAHSWGKEFSGHDTNNLTPFSKPSSGSRHLFCVTSTSKDAPHVIRVLLNKTNRIWEWASKERPVCDTSLGIPTDYTVRVEVCKTGMLESNCKKYISSIDGKVTYKPIGLLQKYGEGDGTGKKVCSKTYIKECNKPSDCGAGEGVCVEKAQMYFGLITGSYTKNLSGGVLRKNIWSILDETNANTGIFQTSENVEGNIILTLDRMKTIGFTYSGHQYTDPVGGTCGWITDRPLGEGECRMWGNPMAEILYEATRYFADKGSPTPDFMYGTEDDSSLKLSKLGTGSKPWIKPYNTYPPCAKPFILAFSDINPSYDSDKVPGTSFGSFSGDLPGLNVSTLADKIGTSEGLAGDPDGYFIGQSRSTYDFICSKKYVSNLSTVRGLCPEEPTKQGSYYSAAIAHYGKTMMEGKTGKPYINTYTVALASPVPDINIKVRSGSVRVVPIGKSVDGCLGVEGSCSGKCTLTHEITGWRRGLLITNCRSDAYCPSNQIVDFYVEDVEYDGDDLKRAKFRINFEDVEQGADHDMDVIVLYEIKPVGGNKIEVTLTSEYAAGCIGQVLGFVISGTTEDGVYLPVRDKDGVWNGPAGGLPLTWTKTFNVSGSPAGVLKDPLWYAAKWGGFEDLNGNMIPDNTKEWDTNGDGIPDTYYLVINPLKLEQQLEKAFTEILKRTASGTAVSVLSTTGEGEGAVYQAYFYPKKMEGAEERTWLGYIHSLFLDPYGNIREDTNGNKTLDLIDDYIIKTVYDPSEGTKVEKWSDSNGDGIADTYMGTVPIDYINPIWNGGKRLWETDPSDRKIYTTIDGYGFVNFTKSAKSTLKPYLRANDADEAGDIIDYISGKDIKGYRERTITIDGKTKVWKLGDIVYSTPTAVSKPMENYDLVYSDQSYNKFRQKYLNRRHVVYLGANDGMLHVFNGGFYDISKHKFCSAYSSGATCPDSDPNPNEIGKELWGFIPRELLPHLKWLTDPNYTHVYYVDLKPKVTDVKIFTDDSTHPGGWGTVLIGGMRYGGKGIQTEEVDMGGGKKTEHFRSTYFALDITDPEQSPRLLWTFDTTDSGVTDLGLTLSYPTVMRVKNEWFVLFGSGPTNFDSLSNLTEFQEGKIFVLKISGGDNGVVKSWTENTNYWRRSTGHSNGFLASPMTVDVDLFKEEEGGVLLYSVDVAYIGESYIQGNENKAVMWRLNTKNTPTVGSWVLSALYNVDSKNDKIKRISASPSAAMDGKGNLWIYFGTGQFFGVGDRNTYDTGAFYGMKDDCWDGSCTTTYSDLVDVSNIIINYGDNPAFNTILTNVGNKAGWAIYFGTMTAETTDFLGNTLQHAGERVTSKPVILAGFVMFGTYVPGGEICSVVGISNQYALYYKTGTAHTRYIFKEERERKGEKPTETVSRVTVLGKGLPTSIGLAVTKEGKLKGFVQTSTGEIYSIKEIDPQAPRPKYTGWKAGGLGGL